VIHGKIVEPSEEHLWLELRSCEYSATTMGGWAAYLQWISVPGDTRPHLDDVLAGLEQILALDDNLECRVAILLLVNCVHDAGWRSTRAIRGKRRQHIHKDVYVPVHLHAHSTHAHGSPTVPSVSAAGACACARTRGSSLPLLACTRAHAKASAALNTPAADSVSMSAEGGAQTHTVAGTARQMRTTHAGVQATPAGRVCR
jgi:hypothetical protein